MDDLGPDLGLQTCESHNSFWGTPLNHTYFDKSPVAVTKNARLAERRPVNLPARLAWKDQRGISRFASVVTRDVSEYGAFVECHSALPISLYRLVQFQLEPGVRETGELPDALRQGKIVAAVYRVARPTSAAKFGLALRLMVEPRRAMQTVPDATRATA